MNTRTRTLQRMKKRVSDSPVPKDYKELEEHIENIVCIKGKDVVF